jgi:hypothetical protein
MRFGEPVAQYSVVSSICVSVFNVKNPVLLTSILAVIFKKDILCLYFCPNSVSDL